MLITISAYSEVIYNASDIAKWLQIGFNVSIVKLEVYHCWMNSHSPSEMFAGIWWKATIGHFEKTIYNRLNAGMPIMLVNQYDIDIPYMIVNKFDKFPEPHLMAH